MSRTRTSGTRTRRGKLHLPARRGAVAVAVATMASVGLVATGVPAQAVPSNFVEMDGNIVHDGTGTYDWSNGGTRTSAVTTDGTQFTRPDAGGVFDGGTFVNATTVPIGPSLTAAAAADPTIADAKFKPDPLSVDVGPCGTGDPTSYTGAGSEVNGGIISTDTFGTSSVPNKDDLSNVYAVAHVATGVNEVYFGGERVINNGDSHIDYEFLQSRVTIPNACSGSFSGHRTLGDFLVSVDFTSGGTFGGQHIYSWVCGSVTPDPVTKVCDPGKGKNTAHYAEVTDNNVLTALKVNVNAGGNLDCGGWACRNPDGTSSPTILTNGLMEGAIDLGQLGFTGCVSTFLPHTRSSQSFTAVLKDFEIIPFNTCAHPTVTTNVHDASHTDVTGSTNLPIGSVLHDTATLHGAVGTPAGSVTYTLYSAADCGGTATDVSPSPKTFSGSVPDSAPVTFSNVGTYYFVATVTFSDSRNLGIPSSGCNDEPVTIVPNTPSVSTKIRNSAGTDVTGTSQPIGTPLHDTATISGATDTAGGSITYTLFTKSDCTTDATHPSVNLTPDSSATADDVVNHVAPDSKTYTFTNAGSYWFYAVYSGDTNNTGPVNSGCSSEPITISPNTPSVTTKIRNSAGTDLTGTSQPIGTVLHDTATISGATATAGGSITYTLFTKSDCTTDATHPSVNLTPDSSATADDVVNGAAPDSKSYTFTNAGSYWFYAVYSGDSNNTGPVNSGCSSEPITISPNSPALHSTPVVQVKDTFSVSGLTNGATGTVTVKVYDGSCSTGTQIGSTATFDIATHVSGGTYSNEITYFAATSGHTYYFQISYSGDNNNSPIAADCTESATATVVSKA